jgi:glycosyltransferase involved in cell wall biosynthesis
VRILFLSTVYPRAYAPTRGVFCASLCRALAARHEVRVVSPVGWLERLRHGCAHSRGERAAEDPPADFPWYFYPPKVLRTRYGWFMWRSIRRTVRRVVERFAPDCVLSYWLHPDGEVAVRAARALGVPCGVIVGGSDALLLPRDPGRRKSIVRVVEEADVLITVSEGLKEKVIELGAPRAKVHAVHQGIDRDLFCPGDRAAARVRLGLPADQNALVWVGRMSPVKGLEILLDACALLRGHGTDFHLYLVGDGPLQPELAARAEARGLSGSVCFVGPVVPRGLPDWYRAADLTVLSSWSEGIPNVLRESLACGTPFVSTRVGDVAELSPETADELVPPGDPAALAGAIRRTLAGQGGRPAACRYPTWQEYADAIADLLMTAASGSPARLDNKDLVCSTVTGSHS